MGKFRKYLVPVVASLALLVVLAGSGWIAYGSPVVAFRYIKGDRVMILNHVATVNTNSPKPLEMTSFRVINLSSTALKLTGAQTHCTCVLTEALPTTVPPWGHHDLEIAVHIRKRGELLAQPLTLFTDNGRIQRWPLLVRGSMSR